VISDELGMQLHHRAARGGMLTAKERVQLATWYEQQDEEEAELAEAVEAEAERLAIENERTKQALKASEQTFVALQRDLAAWEKKLEAWKLADEERSL
jgi:ABC-type lipoprotein export system ATPase subunit